MVQAGFLPTGLDRELKRIVDTMGKEIFRKSQERCPVGKTGNLKASGRYTPLSGGGFSISYDADYADKIDGGQKESRKFQGPYESPIPRHQRKLPSGKTISVRAHTKTYQDMRPLDLGSGWYTYRQVSSGGGTGFLTKTFEEEFNKIFSKHFPKSFGV